MKKQDIEITIGPNGEVSFTMKGVKGKNCLAESAFLEEALGTVVEREHTSEYYEASEGVSQSVYGGGDDD